MMALLVTLITKDLCVIVCCKQIEICIVFCPEEIHEEIKTNPNKYSE